MAGGLRHQFLWMQERERAVDVQNADKGVVCWGASWGVFASVGGENEEDN